MHLAGKLSEEHGIMRYPIFFPVIVLAATFVMHCQKAKVASSNLKSGIEGRVFSIGAPAVSEEWSPSPLERISTIIILDRNHAEVREATTDDLGRFNVSLPAGVYFLRVKESIVPEVTGPFTVMKDGFVSVEAHYDNGMR